MNHKENIKSLDELLGYTIKRDNLKFDFNKWRETYEDAIHDFRIKTGQHATKTRQSIWRIILKSRITKLTMAAAALIFVMFSIYTFTGSIDGTSTAFANAMEHFVAARTARFDLSIEFGDQPPQTSSFLYDAKGYIRQNMANGTVNFVDYNRNKVLSLDPDSKTVLIRDIRKRDFHNALYDLFTELQGLIQQAIDLGHGPVESLGTRTIDGCPAYGYRVETTGQSSSLFWQGKGTLTIWADRETDFPLQLQWYNNVTGIKASVTNLSLDQVFSPEEAGISIPEDYTIKDETLPPPKPKQQPDETTALIEPEPQQIDPNETREPGGEQSPTEHNDTIEPDNIPEPEPQQPELNETPAINIAYLTEGLDESEQTLIKLFHSWTFLTKGKFPSSLTVDAIKDIDPDAQITFKQKGWSHTFSATLPNYFDDWQPDIDPNDYTDEEKQQAKEERGPLHDEFQRQFQKKFSYVEPHFGNIAGGFQTVNSLPAKSDWHYNGQGANTGDTDMAIFWYKPNDSKTYRVIYSDLIIEDILPEDLHLLEDLSEAEIDSQANDVLETAIQLGAQIPKDDRSKVLRMLSLSEKDLIKGLATYLEYSRGKYPASIKFDKKFVKNLDALLTKAFKDDPIDKKTGEEKTLDIGFACFFYNKLVREKKDPAYYGDSVTVNDPDAVLVRWKLSRNKYRVIYASLEAETVTIEQLTELESQLPR